MNYKIPLASLVILVCSCGKKSSSRYSYLNAKMNEETTVSIAELQAWRYERQANGSDGSIGVVTTERATLFEDKANVTLRDDGILLVLDIRISGFGYKAREWVNNTSEHERVSACRQVCFLNIRALAASLSCSPALIEVEWTCMDGSVGGKATGEEALAEWAKEAVAPNGP